MSNHTPTPWVFDGNCGGYISEGGERIARAYARGDAEFIVCTINDLEELRLLAADHRYSSEAIGIAFRNKFPPTDTGSVT